MSLTPPDTRLLLITGPNMGGKSTLMRAVGLICLMAQAGAHVPADSARLPLLRRLDARVGAADQQKFGVSTFMAEMLSARRIVDGADEGTLVVVDELGRGTSTGERGGARARRARRAADARPQPTGSGWRGPSRRSWGRGAGASRCSPRTSTS